MDYIERKKTHNYNNTSKDKNNPLTSGTAIGLGPILMN